MNLIEEIEAAAKRGYEATYGPSRDFLALDLTIDNWWPRIKAALESAHIMDMELDALKKQCSQNIGQQPSQSQRKFREAMEGGA